MWDQPLLYRIGSRRRCARSILWRRPGSEVHHVARMLNQRRLHHEASASSPHVLPDRRGRLSHDRQAARDRATSSLDHFAVTSLVRRACAAALRPANPRRGGPAGAIGWGVAATGLDGKSATVADLAFRSSIALAAARVAALAIFRSASASSAAVTVPTGLPSRSIRAAPALSVSK